MNLSEITSIDSARRTNSLVHLMMNVSTSPSSNDSPRHGIHQMSLMDGSTISTILLFSPSEMRYYRLPLPLKLYAILNASSSEVVSWLPDGRSFQIHRPERFEREILPQYFDFGHQNYLTFVRLLALWKFEAGEANTYRHQYLVRGFPELLCSMYLSDIDGEIREAQAKLAKTSLLPFLRTQDLDSISQANTRSDFPSKLSLKPRLAFGGSPYSITNTLNLFTTPTCSLSRSQHVMHSLDVASEIYEDSKTCECDQGAAVSPTDVSSLLIDEDSPPMSSYPSSPPSKKRRWLPPLGPASSNDQPLFSTRHEEDCLGSSVWCSTNPELFATLAESHPTQF